MSFIDSSIFLCEMLRKPPKQFAGCRKLLTGVRDGRIRASTTIFTYAELVWVLESREGFSRSKILRAIVALDSLKGLRKVPIGDSDLPASAMAVSSKFDVDYVDAVNVLVMKDEGLSEIYSLDSDYDKLSKTFKIKRIIPA